MEYDILMSYGVAAIIVSFIVRAGDRAISRALNIFGGIHGGIMLIIFVLGVLLGLSGANLSLGDMKNTILLYRRFLA